mmetsp:Transcript_21909/g.22233  ORF Transcript_21909/g.22233 Transcript_21909/m.22233 type:complete len:105 (+) Transcript_21909:161-475(+)
MLLSSTAHSQHGRSMISTSTSTSTKLAMGEHKKKEIWNDKGGTKKIVTQKPKATAPSPAPATPAVVEKKIPKKVVEEERKEEEKKKIVVVVVNVNVNVNLEMWP